jgi:hypothetical protein
MNLPSPRVGHDVRSLRERVERKLYRAHKKVRQRFRQGLPRTHVFVAGMQRSGTNMLMEVLEWNPYTDVYHETDRRAFDENYLMRQPAVIRGLAETSHAPFFIIKSLCELDRLHSLLNDFSPAKAVWIVRDYQDSTNSAVRSFANFVPQMRRLAADKNADLWRGHGMSDATQALLRKVAELDPSELDGAAMMWFYRNVLFFEQNLQQDRRVAVLRYEDLVSEPQATLQRLCHFLGILDCGPWMTRYIHDASIRKRQAPDLLPAVASACTELMGRFEALELL